MNSILLIGLKSGSHPSCMINIWCLLVDYPCARLPLWFSTKWCLQQLICQEVYSFGHHVFSLLHSPDIPSLFVWFPFVSCLSSPRIFPARAFYTSFKTLVLHPVFSMFTVDVRYFVCFVFCFLNVGSYGICFSCLFVWFSIVIGIVLDLFCLCLVMISSPGRFTASFYKFVFWFVSNYIFFRTNSISR